MAHPYRFAFALIVLAALFAGGVLAIGSTPPTWLIVAWLVAVHADAIYIGVRVGSAL